MQSLVSMRLGMMTVALALVAACGPSFQVVYEGDSRFEHCYALDENPNVLMQQKGECWSDWIRHYTYGQTRDRVEFAVVRYRAIMRAGTLPTDEAVMGAAPGEGVQGTLAAPAPTSAFASPPKTMGEEVAPPRPAPAPAPALPSAAPEPPGPAPQPPGAACIDGCTQKWQACHGSCKEAACKTCDRTYGKCAGGCFKATQP